MKIGLLVPRQETLGPFGGRPHRRTLFPTYENESLRPFTARRSIETISPLLTILVRDGDLTSAFVSDTYSSEAETLAALVVGK